MKKIIFMMSLSLILMISCGEKKGDAEESGIKQMTVEEQTELTNKAKQIFGVLPDKMPGSENDTPELIALGKKLYSETKLSVNGTQSCNTCHDVSIGKAGVDNKPTSAGAMAGKQGTRNSPTVLNAGFQFVQFWDGRAKDLKEQAKGPILNPAEMGIVSDKDAVKAIISVPEYRDLFVKAYPTIKEPITFDNIANAIAAFERTLVSKSRYDNYMNGNPTALTLQEKQGLKTFIETGCITCHTGNLFGGSMYQKMGLIKPYKNDKDLGRFDVTKNEADKFIFKVPMLRNIALTGPYFHDGTVADLEEAIKTMADINLGKTLKAEESADIKAFLNALSDVNIVK
jgi:cytochrome c peroxidase